MKVFRGTIFLLLAAFLLLLIPGCGDTYRPVANPVNGPGGQPGTTHYALVVNSNPAGDGSTTKIDVSGDTVAEVRTVGVGTSYEALAVGGTSLYVANAGDDSVSEYPLIFAGSTTNINLLPGSHPVALASTISTSMYVLNSGPNSSCPSTGSISTINTSSLAVQFTVCVGVNPGALVQQPGGGFIYILNRGDNSISVYDPGTQTVPVTITTANGLGANAKSLALSSNGAFLFVATQGSGGGPGALNIFATANNMLGGSDPLGVQPTFSYLDPNLNRLYVTNTGDNTVSVFDASNVSFSNNPPMPLLKQAAVGVAPVSVTALPNGSNFYVANSGDNTVSAVSASSFAVLAAIPVEQTPVWVAAEPTSSKVYVVNQGSSSISIIQTSNNAVVVNLPAPTQIQGCLTGCALQQPLMVVTQ